MFLPQRSSSNKGFKRFHKEAGEAAIISIFREIGRSFEGIQAAHDRNQKPKSLSRDDPLTKTGIRANWPLADFRLDGYDRDQRGEQKVRDKGRKVLTMAQVTRVVVRLKFRGTRERFYILLFDLINKTHCPSILIFRRKFRRIYPIFFDSCPRRFWLIIVSSLIVVEIVFEIETCKDKRRCDCCMGGGLNYDEMNGYSSRIERSSKVLPFLGEGEYFGEVF